MIKPSAKPFGRSVVGAIVFGFAALVVVGIAGAVALLETQQRGNLVAHTYEVEKALGEFETAAERVATARRGFLLSSDESYAGIIDRLIQRKATILEALGALTADNPSQRAALDRLRALDEAHNANARTTLERLRADPQLDPRTLFNGDNSVAIIMEIRSVISEMVEREQGLLAERVIERERTLALAYIILGVAGILLLVMAAGTIYVIRRNLAALERSRTTLAGLNEMLEGAVAVRTADLQRANDEIQRFAYIVSHDLRSPLVNVMGFTAELEAATGELSALIDKAETEAPDLVTPEARYAAKEDLPEAIGFIRSSTQKMDRLINAILRLSREGRRVITPEPLDMDAMLAGITDTLQHRLNEVGAEITVEGSLPKIVSDRVAIEQIFSNLVENAVKYLKPGRPGQIRVRARRSGPRMIFEIQDNGRGIDPKDHERVFDLFRRSGTQDQPGEGIGLAHVRALAYRLGGTISCDSALDEGATFRLSIPQTYDAGQESDRT
ncbi:sensor histidine kinase [Aureimonas mangrovi]|uniref:sensor histidine kinase n=1 Tax=Aureimonas mangrovi TaxID=2758041 RepID=UPI001AEEAB96|nr:sensor histidine kinase [Aureimonas mangrovi]